MSSPLKPRAKKLTLSSQHVEKFHLNSAVKRQSQMHRVLWDLERTMNPMIAAQVYNNEHSLLGKLLDEILLQNISHFTDYGSLVTLYCLRRVSRKFR